jgi:beta-galactosidase
MKNDFIPLGVQYYRAPTPLKSDWESDIKNIKKSGFNTIKIWAQWRWNNPKEGIYDFSDLEELMEISKNNDIKVIINIILDVAPVWFYKKCPESIMIKADGAEIKPQVTAYRQIGGAPGPCYHHPEAKKVKKEFVEHLSEKFENHEALLLWDLWNEPELTCGIARDALEADMVCYCTETEKSFKEWLIQKYKSLESLNKTWQRNYNNFDEVELPRNPSVFRDMIDWRNFFAETLVDDLKDRVESVKIFDKHHPVMIHTVPPPYFNMINSCCDDYKMAKYCDLFGNSIGSMPFPAALSVSSAKNKIVINAEIHAVGGETFNRPGIQSFNDFKRHIFTPFSRGIKGFLFWQYRPELLGRESPAWGLTNLKGGSTDNLQYAERINQIFLQNNQLMAGCKPFKSEIAVIKDNYNEIFAWCANKTTDKYIKSLMGSFGAFYAKNYNVDIITTDQILDEGLSQYKLVYYPLPYYMNESLANILKSFVHDGGSLVSEAFFGAYRAENGLHSVTVPGYGFDEVFGVKEGVATTASSFIAAYGENWVQENSNRDIFVLKYDDGLSQFDFKGYFFYEELIPDGGKTLAYFADGKSAIVENNYGKGKAIIAGTLIGAGYEITKDVGNTCLFEMLAMKAGVLPSAYVNVEDIRADILTTEDRIVIIINNSSNYSGEVSITFKNKFVLKTIFDLENMKIVDFVCNKNNVTFKIQIDPLEIRIFSAV